MLVVGRCRDIALFTVVTLEYVWKAIKADEFTLLFIENGDKTVTYR